MKLVSRELLGELTTCALESAATEWCVTVYEKKLQGPRKWPEWLVRKQCRKAAWGKGCPSAWAGRCCLNLMWIMGELLVSSKGHLPSETLRGSMRPDQRGSSRKPWLREKMHSRRKEGHRSLQGRDLLGTHKRAPGREGQPEHHPQKTIVLLPQLSASASNPGRI